MRTKRRRISAGIAAVLWAATIFTLSSIPGSNLPPGDYSVPGHFALYFVLGALTMSALGGQARARALWAVALASAYGASDEVHQLFVAGRCADSADWLVDTLGAAAAVALILLVTKLRTSSAGRR
ncbi:MAG: VanZ family protein [Coriobacteriia bacterium]|nr:VanZ family protein [Coriobacteriia bacterium]